MVKMRKQYKDDHGTYVNTKCLDCGKIHKLYITEPTTDFCPNCGS